MELGFEEHRGDDVQLNTPSTTSLAEIDDTEDAELIRLLEHEDSSYRRRVRAVIRMVVGSSITVAGFTAAVIAYAAITRNWAVTSVLGLVGFFGLIGFASFFTLPSRRQKKAALALAKRDDVRALGPLLNTLRISETGFQTEVLEAVTRLLPLLDRATASELSSEHVEAVNSMIRRYAWFLAYSVDRFDGSSIRGLVFDAPAWRRRVSEFVIAAVSAAPLYGNRKTLTYIERLRKIGPGREMSMKELHTIEVAESALRQRLEEEEKSARLLRPAHAATEDDALLRPAAATESDNDLLLRASE